MLSTLDYQLTTARLRVLAVSNCDAAYSVAAEPRYGKGNRLIQKGDTEYRWDAEGRLEEKWAFNAETGKKDVWRYRWNARSLLEAVITPSGELFEYAYDPFGRRVEKRVGKAVLHGERRVTRSVTRFVWDGDVLVHEITRRAQAAGDPVVEVKTYCFEDNGFTPVAHRDAGGWFHYVNDPIGTPERLVGADGKVAYELRRDAWGRAEVAPGSKTQTAIRFQGQYEDEETGLCYNRFRYYDPEGGRYISSDPSGLFGGLNGFGYVRNTLGWIDPHGLLEIFRSGKVTVDAYAGPPAGGKEHLPLHAHMREGNYETRVLMQDYYKKGKLVGCTGDVYPGDPAMTKGMKKLVADPGTLSTLSSRTDSVYHTGKF